jgi:hypothetical protein
MAFTHALATNNYGPAKFIVDASAANGTHTTITAALSDAVSGETIFIRPGSYTENLTLKAGVNLAAYVADGFTPNVTIVGTLACSYSGTASVSGMRLQTNSANAISLTGANATILNVIDCNLNFTNNDGISSTGSNAAASIFFTECTGDLGTTGIKIFNSTNGSIEFRSCYITNSGGSSTASTASGTNFTCRYSAFLAPFATSGSTLAVGMWETNINTVATNTTCLAHASTAAGSFLNNVDLNSGTATPLTVAASSTITVANIILNSSNAAAVSGSGTLVYAGINQKHTVGTISTTTTTGKGTVGVQGNATAPAGYLGEEIRSYNSSAQNMTNNTPINITSISLTPGTWSISGIGQFGGGAITGTLTQLGISVNSASFTGVLGGESGVNTPTPPTAAATNNLTLPEFVVRLSATTTYYLVANALFSAGTQTCLGRISAIRIA